MEMYICVLISGGGGGGGGFQKIIYQTVNDIFGSNWYFQWRISASLLWREY